MRTLYTLIVVLTLSSASFAWANGGEDPKNATDTIFGIPASAFEHFAPKSEADKQELIQESYHLLYWVSITMAISIVGSLMIFLWMKMGDKNKGIGASEKHGPQLWNKYNDRNKHTKNGSQ